MVMPTVSGSSLEGDEDNQVILPTLRQDLEILHGSAKHTGEPTWMLFDPLRNQYFRINRLFFLFLNFWDLETVDKVKSAIVEKLKRPVSDEEISQFLKFLFDNQLTNVPPQDGYRSYSMREAASRKSFSSTVLHGYLFFKIPLFRPDKFLAALWPFVGFLFTGASAAVFALLGVLGLYLVSRQWSSFETQFAEFLSLEGFVFYALSLAFVKVCHELGHAFMAHKYGLKVSVIGAAFLVLMPILYTDTSNAWRLKSRRKRLMIDFAGIFTELALACFATVLWVFLPDGVLRSATFSIAAVSWVMSLLINLNPFMRFDGYYILSDSLGVENLQERGFALGRWKLRELLFGVGLPPPEHINKSLHRSLIVHAWATWIYRFFLFIGIAILVYSFFIKAIAIFLFVVEILYFILLPIFREISVWWGMRSMIFKSRRSVTTLLVVGLLLFFFFAPMSSRVSVNAVLHADQEVTIYPPIAGRLAEINVSNGHVVKRGQRLASVYSRELMLKTDLVKRRIELLEKRLNRSNADRLENMNLRIIKSELAGEYEELENLREQQSRLIITADVSGVVVDHAPSIHAGRYVGQTRELFKIRSQLDYELTGAVSEKDVGRLALGAVGTFYPENMQLTPVRVVLEKIHSTAAKSLSFPDLATINGGDVPVEVSGSDGQSEKVSGSYYAMGLNVTDDLQENFGQTQRGTVKLAATRVSYAELVFARIASVLRRESGF